MSADDQARQHALSHPQMPGLFHDADRRSLEGQRQTLKLRGLQLVLLVGAALLAIAPLTVRGIEWGVLGAGVAFAAAFLTEATILSLRPEKTWYQCRAIAESVKSLAWRYAVGGHPFHKPGPAESADKAKAAFANRMRELLTEFETAGLIPSKGSASVITTWMQDMRESPIEVRKAVYKEHRIASQQAWYSTKARLNQRSSTQWSLGLLAVQVLGVTGAVLKGTGVIHVDVLGLMAAVAASAVAWLQINQHSTLMQSYAQAAWELLVVLNDLDAATDSEWAKFVNEAESAISREQTAWLTRRIETRPRSMDDVGPA
jgi:conflict system pore-forming effector with SLATT domain